jgi:DNA-binding CsgD family transcriptional regulator
MQSLQSGSKPSGTLGSDVGVIVLGPSHVPIASNREAVRVLAYPNDPEQIHNMEAFLRQKISTVLLVSTGTQAIVPGFVSEIRSGKRRYMCTALAIDNSANSANPITYALLLERWTRTSVDLPRVALKYGLTPRETELVQNLVLGLTTKEIAVRMKVSPSTVNAFLHLVMVKMGVKTRSGVVREIVCPSQ